MRSVVVRNAGEEVDGNALYHKKTYRETGNIAQKSRGCWNSYSTDSQHLEKNEPAGANSVITVQFIVLCSVYPRPVNEGKKEDGITNIFPVGVRGDMTGYLPDAGYVNKIIE